jgi:hypothetical protein
MENTKDSPKIKSRKFIYEIERFNENKIESLKNEFCKYHIIGYNNDLNENYTKISGFICFQNPRYVTSVVKLLGLQNIQHTNEDSYVIHKRISEMDTFWENGELPKQSHNKTTQKTKISKTNPMIFIMNQNQQLLQNTFDQQKQLFDSQQQLLYNEKLLLEQNKQLIEENTKLKQHSQNTLCITNENSNNITNSNNKTLNINMFLNNDCKDAITLTDFIKNIQIENEDLFYAKEHGFTEAIIRVLENGLKNYDVTERPLHCTDTKRETMHIKNESGWHKEIGSKSDDISKAIKNLSRKKMEKVSKYINGEGKCEFASKKFEENLNMMREVANGVAYPEQHIKKIVKNLVNNVKLEKGVIFSS